MRPDSVPDRRPPGRESSARPRYSARLLAPVPWQEKPSTGSRSRSAAPRTSGAAGFPRFERTCTPPPICRPIQARDCSAGSRGSPRSLPTIGYDTILLPSSPIRKCAARFLPWPAGRSPPPDFASPEPRFAIGRHRGCQAICFHGQWEPISWSSILEESAAGLKSAVRTPGTSAPDARL